MIKIMKIGFGLWFYMFVLFGESVQAQDVPQPIVQKDTMEWVMATDSPQVVFGTIAIMKNNDGADKSHEIAEPASEKTIEKDSPGFLSEENEMPDLSKFLKGDNIFYSVVFLLFGYLFIKIVSFVLNALAERSTNYRITFKGAIPIVKIVVWVLVLTMIVVVIFQPSVATMLAFSASIGVAVGFASQDILKNIFGGIVILIDRPFMSGDKIEVAGYYGEVVEIGLRSTRIVTPDDSLVSVPNSVMMSSSVSNANAGEPNCQVVPEIFLPITIDTVKVRNIATQAAMVSKYIYLDKPITVLFFNEANNHNSYYKMRIKAYVMDIRDEFKFKSDVTELVIGALVKEGIMKGYLVDSQKPDNE